MAEKSAGGSGGRRVSRMEDCALMDAWALRGGAFRWSRVGSSSLVDCGRADEGKAFPHIAQEENLLPFWWSPQVVQVTLVMGALLIFLLRVF